MSLVIMTKDGKSFKVQPGDVDECIKSGMVIKESESKESLIKRAVELQIAAPSTMARWSIDRIKKEISNAEK